MSAVVVQCPHCSVSLKLKAAPRPGAKLKCPKCQKVFSPAPDDVPADDEFADLPPLPPRGGLPPRIGASSKSKSIPAAKSKKKKESGGGVPIVLIASIVGVVVLAGIGGGVYFMLRGEAPAPTPTTNQVAGNSGAAATTGVGTPASSGSNSAVPASGAVAAKSSSSTTALGGDTPEAAYASMSALGQSGKIAEMVKFVNPDSRKMLALQIAGDLGEMKIPDMRNKLKAVFAKWKADITPLERTLTLVEGKNRRETMEVIEAETANMKEAPSLAYFEAIQEFFHTEKPELFQRPRRENPNKVADIEINGDKAIGSLVSQIEVHSYSSEQDPKTGEQKRVNEKTEMREQREPMHFVKLEGRWFVDMATTEKSRGGRPSARKAPQVVQKATLQNQTPQQVYDTFLKAMAGSDWETHLETLSPAYKDQIVLGMFLMQREKTLPNLVMYPNQANTSDKQLIESLKQQGLDINAAAKVANQFVHLHELNFKEAKAKLTELLKPVKSIPAMYALLRKIEEGGHVAYVKMEHANQSVVDAVIDGDKATVILRNSTHPKTNPASLELYPAVRIDSKWYVENRPEGVPPKLPEEVLKRYLDHDTQLSDTISAAKAEGDKNPPSVSALAISPDEQTLVTGGSSEYDIHVWDMSTRKEKAVIKNLGGSISVLEFSRDGKVLMAAVHGGSGMVKVDPVSGTILHKIPLPGQRPWLNGAALTPDGNLAFAVSEVENSAEIVKFDFMAGKVAKTGKLAKRQDFRGIAVSPDGLQLATADFSRFLRLWDSSTLKETAALRMSTADRKERSIVSHAVAYSPDGKTLAITLEKEIQFWDPAGKKLIKRINHPATNPMRLPDVLHIRWSADGKRFASTAADNTIVVWDVTSGKPLATLNGHATLVSAFEFSKDGKTLVSGDSDGAIKFWKLP